MLSPQWILVILAVISVLVGIVGLCLNIYWRHHPKPSQRGRELEQKMSEGGK